MIYDYRKDLANRSINKAENADFQSYAAERGYITTAMLVLSNAKAK